MLLLLLVSEALGAMGRWTAIAAGSSGQVIAPMLPHVAACDIPTKHHDDM
jgi:hypothetical protein